MCLLTKELYPKEAQEDIPVYKVTRLHGGEEVTAYKMVPIPESGILEGDPTELVPYLDDEYYEINGGMIHSYSSFVAARKCTFDFECYLGVFSTSIRKAIIPKGATYYTGLDDTLCSSILIIQRD